MPGLFPLRIPSYVPVLFSNSTIHTPLTLGLSDLPLPAMCYASCGVGSILYESATMMPISTVPHACTCQAMQSALGYIKLPARDMLLLQALCPLETTVCTRCTVTVAFLACPRPEISSRQTSRPMMNCMVVVTGLSPTADVMQCGELSTLPATLTFCSYRQTAAK